MANFNIQQNGAPNLEDFKNELPPMHSQEFDEHLSTEQIKQMVYQLLTETNCSDDDNKRRNKKFQDIRGKYQRKYQPLMMRYPALFNMIIENGKDFDLIQFEQMMGMISKVRSKQVAEEVASKEFGQKMVDKYVKPKI